MLLKLNYNIKKTNKNSVAFRFPENGGVKMGPPKAELTFVVKNGKLIYKSIPSALSIRE